MSDATPDDLRSAADVIDADWSGWHHDDRLGWNPDRRGTPAADYAAALRAEADRMERPAHRAGTHDDEGTER